MANLAVSTNYIESGVTITVVLFGTSTSWANGVTTFTVSGVTGATFTPTSWISTVAVMGTLYAGVGSGTLTISDGTNSGTVTVFATVSDEYNGGGFRIPVGSLDTWRAARDAASSARAEVVCMGDSTTYGSGATYGWPMRMRVNSIAAGYADGGRGMVQSGDSAGASGPTDNMSSIVSASGFAGGDNVDYIDNGVVWKSSTVGNTLVLQGYGRYIRLHYTQYKSCGNFTYSVDGGTAVAITDANINASSSQAVKTGAVWIDTGDTNDGLHTITIVNTGAIVPAPSITTFSSSNQTPGISPTPATKYYVATVTDSAGESLPSAEFAKTFANSANDGGTIQVTPGLFQSTTSLVKATIYRADVSGGPYYKLSDSTGSTSTVFTYTEVGNATDGVTQPPSVSHTTYSTSAKEVRVLPDFLKGKGLVWHQNARSGATHGSFFLDPTATACNNWPAEVAMGLVQQTSPKTPAAHPQFRDMKLLLLALGINTQQGSTPWDAGPSRRGTENGITYGQAAGADVVVVIEHYKYGSNPSYAPAYIDAQKQAAVFYGCAWVDFGYVLDSRGATVNANPHRSQEEYNAEADYLWTNILLSNEPQHPDIGTGDESLTTVYMNQNDTGPDLRVVIKGADGVATDLTNASSVVFHMRLVNGTTLKVNASATIETAASGIVRYVWQSGDCDTVGLYDAEFQVTWTDGKVWTYPNVPNSLRVYVKEEVG